MTEDLDPTLDSGSQPTVPSSMEGGGFGDFADPNQLEGRTLGDFRLLHEIGRGGMGIVHKAEQLSLQRPVALKILPAQLTMNERALERFQREASITAQLVHRNIVDIYAVGEAAGVHFIAMELVQGSNLEQLIQRMRGEDFGELSGQAIRDIVSVHPLHGDIDSNLSAKRGSGSKLPEVTPSPRKATSSAHSKNYVESVVKLVAQIADGLHHAHQAGVIHRDIKPANILVRADGTPVLTDFGLARAEGLPNVSATGEFAGTPNYVSPEQAMAHRIPVDHRTDIFSLGATLYELLTLELAFGGDSIHTVLQKIISKEVRDPTKLNPILAPDLVTIIYKTLEKDPDRRYQTAEEFAEDLRAFASYRPINATRTPSIVRAFRWMRREPLKAAGIMGAIVGLPTVLALLLQLQTKEGELQASESVLQAFDAQLQAQKLEQEVDVMLQQAWLALAERNDELAEERFGEILAKKEDSVEARSGQALALVGQRRHTEALAVLDASKSEEEHPALAYQRAEILRFLGKLAEAEAIQSGLAEPNTSLERYLRAMTLLRDSPLNSFYRRGANSSQYQPKSAERVADARRLLNRVVREEPDYVHAYYALAWATWAAGARDEDTLGYMADKWGDRAATHFWIGIAWEAQDRERALASFARALELDPDYSSARVHQLLVQMDAGDYDDREGIEELVAISKLELEKNRTYAADHANLAVALFGLDRWEEAVDAANDALFLDSGLTQAYDTLGTSLAKLGRHEEAAAAFESALDLDPDSSILQSELGYCLLQLGDVEGALARFEQGIALGDANAMLLSNAGSALRALGRTDEAEQRFRQAVALDEHLADAWYGLGIVQMDSRKLYESIESLQRSLQLAPENPEYFFALGNALALDGSLDEAAVAFQNAIDLDPGNQTYYATLDYLHVVRNRLDDKLAMYRTRLEAMPDDPNALHSLAWVLIDPDGDPAHRDPAQALELATEALSMTEGSDPLVLDTYAYALFANDRVSEAIRHQRRAIEIFKANPAGVLPGQFEGVLEAMEAHLATFQEAQ